MIVCTRLAWVRGDNDNLRSAVGLVPLVMCQGANHKVGVVVPRSLIQAQTSQIDFGYKTVVLIISVEPGVNKSSTIYTSQAPRCLLVKALLKSLTLGGLLVLAGCSIGHTVLLYLLNLSPQSVKRN